MTTLSKELRKVLERAVLDAREIAEKGSADAIVSYGVRDAKAPPHLDEAGKLLRRKLRAHGRQVGDKLVTSDIQNTVHLTQECAYEHWHRMLFARFLAENDLLRHPDHGVSLSLDECQDLAREQGLEVWELAGQFAQQMLPEIFRSDDPVLMLRLPAEARNKLLKLLKDIPREVFLADDSLGWVYQFWQSKKKEVVNESGIKIGADEIASVTQLFTEDYMVEFLFHNTIGAWWVAKRLGEGKINQKIWGSCQTEDDCRKVVRLGTIDWKYLRFTKKDDGQWLPAAGGFESWPKLVKELKIIDPCMGSGHFLVSALSILVTLRMEEENISQENACIAVLKDNLFGLEIDLRCAQIAAFNLAFSAWKICKYQPFPAFNLACSGLTLNSSKSAWLQLVGKNENFMFSMGRLYDLFQKAPYFGSLINPHEDKSVTFSTPIQDLLPYLERAIALETDEDGHELAVSAKGMAKAAEVLASQFTLVVTNVPYLGRGKQDEVIKDYCERIYPEAKADLATCFLQRCTKFCKQGGSIALVTPQSWLFQGSYDDLRQVVLDKISLNTIGILGPRCFETISGDVVNAVLIIATNTTPLNQNQFLGIDASRENTPSEKADKLREASVEILVQSEQKQNPDCRISVVPPSKLPTLAEYAEVFVGFQNGDTPRWVNSFWEHPIMGDGWEAFHATPERPGHFEGLDSILRWEDGKGELSRSEGCYIKGREAWGRRGVLCRQTQPWPTSLYLGSLYDQSSSVLVPKSVKLITPLYCFLQSEDFHTGMLSIANTMKFTNSTFVKVPFDLVRWQKVAAEQYPHGLPKPYSSNPTQWLFNGHPLASDQPLHVAVARLLGYQWPRQVGSNFPDCPALGLDGLENFADSDGIVCLTSLRGESAVSDSLRELLATAYGAEWTSQKEKELILSTGSNANNFDDWLRDDFFMQHCILFHHRPFVWHIWDGRKDGFHAFVNYHRLAGGGGVGRRTLESLLYSYLGEWITRQREAVKRSEAGADGRLAAALELQEELKKILAGEPPYDIFVRWKPLNKQAIGWEPDINDGVRLNIRPFMMANLSKGKRSAGILRDKPNIKWDKDRGNEPSQDRNDFPWFWGWDGSSKDFIGSQKFDGNRWNDCHYSNAVKRKVKI